MQLSRFMRMAMGLAGKVRVRMTVSDAVVSR